MTKLVLTEEREAWRAINPPHEPDCEMQLLLSDLTVQNHIRHNGPWHLCEEFEMEYRGDPIAVIKPHELRRPESPRDGATWELRYWGETWRRIPANNQSWMVGRQRHNPIERALAEYWAEESVERRGCNYGCGEAQDLILSIQDHETPDDLSEGWLTNRERRIMASLVQWLGTNCGRGMLIEAYWRGGWKLHLEALFKPVPVKTDALCECRHHAFQHVGQGSYMQAPCMHCDCADFKEVAT